MSSCVLRPKLIEGLQSLEPVARLLLCLLSMLCKLYTFKIFACLFAALMLLEPTAALASDGKRGTVAVVPARDGDADAASDDIANSLSELLRLLTDRAVVAARTAEGVAVYQQTEVSHLSENALTLIESAKEHYFTFQGTRALSEIEEAISLLKERSLSQVGDVLLDALLSKALIAKAGGQKRVARAALGEALAIDPRLSLPAADYPPSIVLLLESVRTEQALKPTGSLAVHSKPPSADVALNGVVQGMTPLLLSDLPVGNYALTVSANRYTRDVRTVAIEAERETKVRVKLRWNKSSKESKSYDLHSMLKIADALKVERLVRVDADGAPDGRLMLNARMVDAKARASLKALQIEGLDPEHPEQQMQTLANELAAQLDADVLSHPQKTLEPVGEGGAIVLGKRKKPLTKQPLFWGAVGVMVAGAIAGGIVAAMSSGGSDTGSLKVNFR